MISRLLKYGGAKNNSKLLVKCQNRWLAPPEKMEAS